MKKRCNEQPQSAAEEVLSELPIESQKCLGSNQMPEKEQKHIPGTVVDVVARWNFVVQLTLN